MNNDFSSRYRDYDVLSKRQSPDWDEQTWQAIQQRISSLDSLRFFTDAEAAVLEAVVDRIIPQPDREPDKKIPIVPWIDGKLFHDQRDGYRYEDIPPQREAWRLAVEGFDQSARALCGKDFRQLTSEQQDDVLRTIEGGSPPGEAWKTMSAKRFFRNVLCITVTKAYYSHPSAWNEIGYSGPAAIRGHVRVWIGGVDPWEAHARETPWDTE